VTEAIIKFQENHSAH